MVALRAPADTPWRTWLELYEGMAETGMPVVGGDTTRVGAAVLSVTALGRAERIPAARARGRATCSW